MSKGIFITGTDTGVGKTYIATGLIRAMRHKGIRVCPMKPVETGCTARRGQLVPSDSIALMKASGADESVDAINPCRLRLPLAPSVAAEIEGVPVKPGKMLSSYRRLLARYDIIVVEGAGGIMVPLWKDYIFLDLVRDMQVPLIVVSRPGLGTINHTLLTIESARNRGIDVIGVIFNYTWKVKKGFAEKTNPHVIEKLGGTPVFGEVPYGALSSTRDNKLFNNLAEKIMAKL